MQINSAIQDLRQIYSTQLIAHDVTPDQHCHIAKLRFQKIASTIWSCETIDQVRNMETFVLGFQHQTGIDKQSHKLGFTRTLHTVTLQVSLCEILEMKVKQILTKKALNELDKHIVEMERIKTEMEWKNLE